VQARIEGLEKSLRIKSGIVRAYDRPFVNLGVCNHSARYNFMKQSASEKFKTEFSDDCSGAQIVAIKKPGGDPGYHFIGFKSISFLQLLVQL
jgi:hypothetical protein